MQAALAALAAVCLFWLPYHVPVSPSLSDSYLFGFNNRACWLLFVACVSLLALFGPAIKQPVTHGTLPGSQDLRWALPGTFLASVAMYLLTRKLNGYDEAIYLIDRLRLVLEGRIPYRDFEYAYGAGLLYGPAALARLLHLGAADAYGIFYVLSSLLGVLLLHVCCRWMAGTVAGGRSAFWFVWAVSLLATLNFGLNYALLRFDLPICFVLLIQRVASAQRGGGYLAFGLAALGYGVMLGDSPELAVAFAAAVSVYLAFVGQLRAWRAAVAYLALLGGLALMTALAAHLGVFRTMLAFRTGGFNFPVIPAPAIVLFLLAAGIVACQVRARDPRHGGQTALPLFLLGVFTAAAALGRCDPTHILLEGLPFFLPAVVLTGGMPRPWKWFPPALWLCFVLVPLGWGFVPILNALGKSALPTLFAMERGDHLTRFDLWVLHRMQRQLGEPLAAEKFAEYRAAAHRGRDFNLTRLFGQAPGTVFAAPYGFSVTHFGLYHAANVDEGYFFETINVITPEQVEAKVQELKAHPERPLLLLPGREQSCAISADAERALISHLFLFPYRARAVHPASLSLPLCAYIQAHYRRSIPADPPHFGYALWTPVRWSDHTPARLTAP